MPIYAYRCASCGHAQDVLRKISDPVLTRCPACGAESFQKQVTAAGFQLKGTGWYVTDFRGGNSQGSAEKSEAPKTSSSDESASSKSAESSPPAAASPAPETKTASSPSGSADKPAPPKPSSDNQ